MDKSTMYFLLARFMDTEYQTELLSNVSTKSLDMLKQDMYERFDGTIELTEDDIKSAWKEWFDWAANGGTLVSPHLQLTDPEVGYRHDELQVVDLVIELACKAIDRL